AVDDLAHAREQVLARAGDAPADHDHGRVEQVDERREDLTDVPPGLPGRLDREGVARAHESDDVLEPLRGHPLLREPLRDRRARGDRLEVALVVGVAGQVTRTGYLDVPDVASRALCAA